MRERCNRLFLQFFAVVEELVILIDSSLLIFFFLMLDELVFRMFNLVKKVANAWESRPYGLLLLFLSSIYSKHYRVNTEPRNGVIE